MQPTGGLLAPVPAYGRHLRAQPGAAEKGGAVAIAVSHLSAGSQPAAAADLPASETGRRLGSQPGGGPSCTIWIRAPVARLCPLLHNPSIRARRVYGRGAGGEQSTADAVDRAGHKSYYDKSVAGGGGNQQPPARQPSHPTTPGGAAEGGAQPPTPPAALHHSPRRRTHASQLRGEAPAQDSCLRAVRHTSGTVGWNPAAAMPRHATPSARRGEAACPPALRGRPKRSPQPSVISQAPGLPAGG